METGEVSEQKGSNSDMRSIIIEHNSQRLALCLQGHPADGYGRQNSGELVGHGGGRCHGAIRQGSQTGNNANIKVNVLVGKSPNKGSTPLDGGRGLSITFQSNLRSQQIGPGEVNFSYNYW